MQKQIIKNVEIKKTGRFWAVNVDHKLLGVVLYKRGAVAVQELLQNLGGIAVTDKEAIQETPKKKASKPTKVTAKSKTKKRIPTPTVGAVETKNAVLESSGQ